MSLRQQLLGLGLVDPLRAALGALGLGLLAALLLLLGALAEHLGLLQRQQGLAPDVLGQRRDVAVVDQLDPVEVLVDVARGQLLADLAGVGEGGAVGEADVGVRTSCLRKVRAETPLRPTTEKDASAPSSRTRRAPACPRG